MNLIGEIGKEKIVRREELACFINSHAASSSTHRCSEARCVASMDTFALSLNRLHELNRKPIPVISLSVMTDTKIAAISDETKKSGCNNQIFERERLGVSTLDPSNLDFYKSATSYSDIADKKRHECISLRIFVTSAINFAPRSDGIIATSRMLF